jgi:hypothetical protein
VKKLITTILVITGAIGLVPAAQAHATLTHSYPVANKTVTGMPTKVWLEFDDDLLQIAGKSVDVITLTDSMGMNIPTTKQYVGGARLTAELPASKMTGRIKMSWRVVSNDGHPVSGSIYFTVKPKK